MRNLFVIGILISFISACTHVNIEEELPSVQNLAPQNIVTQLPVVHLEADPAEIVILLRSFDSPVEVATTVTIYGENKDILVQEEAIIEIKGVGSAAQDMKPFGVTLENAFNNTELQIITPTKVAAGDDLGTIQNFRLRNSSQDYGITMLKDLAYTELALRSGLDLELKYGRPAHVFLNSEYYGLHNFRTEVDRLALSHSLQVDSNTITLLKLDSDNKKLEFRDGNELLADRFIEAIKQKDVHTIKEVLDIDNFIDYIVFEDYIGNHDWPHNNARAYCINDSKFRFLLYDLDMAATRTKNPILPEMEYNKDHISQIYQILLALDPSFRSRMQERQKYWYTQFTPELFNSIVDELADNIALDMTYFISKRGVPESTFQWKLNLEQLKRDFQQTDKNNRKKYQIN